MLSFLLVFIGGSLGTLCRWLATDVLFVGNDLLAPGLLLVNVAGAGTLGIVAGLRLSHGALLLGTGFAGGFTSYSALAALTHPLFIHDANQVTVVIYLLVTFGLGLAAVWVGLGMGDRLRGKVLPGVDS